MTEDANLVALRWQEAIAADTVDWLRLTDWLEADIANREAFSAVTQIGAMLQAHGLGRDDTPDHDTSAHDTDRFAAGTN